MSRRPVSRSVDLSIGTKSSTKTLPLGDELGLGSQKSIQAMLNAEGQNTPLPEQIVSSCRLSKLNRKSAKQKRIMLVTDKAIYNIAVGMLTKSIRRIPLEDLGGVTVSEESKTLFTVHVPSIYDFRYDSESEELRAKFVQAIKIQYEKRMRKLKPHRSSVLLIRSISKDVGLAELSVTKDLLSKLSAAEIKRRRSNWEIHPIESAMLDDDVAARLSALSLNNSPQPSSTMLNGSPRKTDPGPIHSLSEPYLVVARKSSDALVGGRSLSLINDVTGLYEKPSHNMENVSLADFEMVKELGRGAFGKVKLAKKKSDGKMYAIKILNKADIIRKDQVEHTKTERKIMERMTHPFVMSLRYAFTSQNHLYLVQDYFQGGELMTHLRSEGKFDEQTTRVVTAEIYLAISHLHDKGIVYRDLKPENILLDEKGHICLTDFGMSKDLSTTKSGRSNTFCGTPEFISPEVVEGKEHDRAVDLWGFGVLIYLLICGCTPFAKSLQNPDQQMMTGPDIDNLYRAILTSTILYPKGMSPHCRHLIQCLLNRRPDSRLGYKDKKEVLSHPFYNQINWKDLLHKKLDTGLMPNGKPRSIDEPPPPYETPTPTPLRRRTSNNVQYPLVRTNSKSPAPAPSALKNKLTGSPRVGMGNLVSRVLNLKADEMSLTQPQLSPPVGAASSSSDPSSPQLKASPPPAALSPLFPPLLLDGAQQENNTDSSPLPDSPTRLTFSRPHTTLNKAVDPSPDLTKAILPTSTNASPFILNTRSARSSVQGNVQQENLLGKVQENLLGQIQENLLGKVQESLLASTVNFPPPPTGDEKDNVNFPPPPTGDEKDNEGKESSRSPMIQESPPRLQEEQEPFAQQHISLLSSFPNAISSLSSFPQVSFPQLEPFNPQDTDTEIPSACSPPSPSSTSMSQA